MPSGFTEEQVQAAVDQFLLREVSVGTLKTGARDTSAGRDTVLDLISTALLLRPDSFFFAVWQATNRLRGVVAQQISMVDSIAEAGPGVSRPAKLIASTYELTNAQAALLEVNAGLSDRTVGVRGALGPAVDRFRRAISGFVSSELNKNVLVAGEVIETADDLKAQVRELWSDGIDRHTEILERSVKISTALSQLEGVSLPRSAVQSIVAKISTRLGELEETLAGNDGLQASKQAFLELLTMRTLLSRASAFRAPSFVLAPQRSDSDLLVQVGTSGLEASTESSVSAPYNYDVGADLDLSINGAALTVPLPRSSRAEALSRVMTGLFPTPAGTAVVIELDLGATISYAPPAYASGATAASDLTANLAGVTVTWDGAAGVLTFRSNATTDQSRLRFLVDTAPRAAFVEAFGVPLLSLPSPPTAREVQDAIHAATPSVDAEVVEVIYGSFGGTRESALTTTVWDKQVQGINLAVNGTNTVSSPTVNFERAGVRVDMALQILSPPASVGEFVITGVSGGVLTLDAVVPGPPATAAYFVGPDYRDVPDGARVQIVSRTNQENTGFYRVAAGGGGVASLELDRTVPSEDGSLSVTVFTHTLQLAARGASTTAGIGVTAANAIGFTVGPEARALLTELELTGAGDFLSRGVRSGDLLSLVSPLSVAYSRTLSSVTGTRLTVVEPLPYVSGNWSYEIRSARVSAYRGMAAEVEAFLGSSSVQQFADLDALIGRLSRGAKYAGAISTGLQTYRAALVDLRDALDGYVVPAEPSISNAVRTMREQGFDRAVDLFLSADISTFFGMDPEGVSYASWLAYQGARAAREVAPISKLSRGALILQEWRPLSFQLNNLDLRANAQNKP